MISRALHLLAFALPLAAAESAPPPPALPAYRLVFTLEKPGEKPSTLTVTTRLEEDFATPPESTLVIQYPNPAEQPDEKVALGTFASGRLRQTAGGRLVLNVSFEKKEVLQWRELTLPDGRSWRMPSFTGFRYGGEVELRGETPLTVARQNGSKLTVLLTAAPAAAAISPTPAAVQSPPAPAAR